MQVIRCKSASKRQYVKWKFTAVHHKTRSESDDSGRKKKAPITRIFICWNWGLFLFLITQFQKKINSIKAEGQWKECLACHLCSFGTFWVLFYCSYWLMKHSSEENEIRDWGEEWLFCWVHACSGYSGGKGFLDFAFVIYSIASQS